MSGNGKERAFLPFRAVNMRSAPGHDPGLQRHHLLPRALLNAPSFSRMFAAIGCRRQRFENFRENGLLLPSNESAALRLGMPLHRGPHPRYTALVMERVGQIEAAWCARREVEEARMRLTLLQQGLRRYLLSGRAGKVWLNRHDPAHCFARHHDDFTDLDALVDSLWADTEPSAVVATLVPMPSRQTAEAPSQLRWSSSRLAA